MNLLLMASLRHVWRQPLQSGLSVLGVALGVAVILAIDLASGSAKRAFEIANETVAGRATHMVRGGPRGIPEALYVQLRREHGLRDIAPVVSGPVELDGRSMQLLGIDPLADGAVRAYGAGAAAAWQGTDLIVQPNTVLVAALTADAVGVRSGGRLDLHTPTGHHGVTVLAVLAVDDLTAEGLRNVLVCDIATAQELLGMPGYLSHIDVVTDDPAALAERLPPGVRLVPSETRNRALSQMTRAFELNLTALGLLAVLIGAFLIHNVMLLSILQRHALIARLRALGVARGQILITLMCEALLLAVVGALLGLGLGRVLAEGLLGLVTRTINDLYFVVAVESVSVRAVDVFKAAGIGLASAGLAALAPVLEVTRLTPRLAFSRAHREDRARRAQRAGLWWALGCWLGAGLVLLLSERSIVAGFAGVLLVIVGFALSAPALMARLAGAAAVPAERCFGLRGRWATRSILASLSRTQVAVVALAVALAATVGVGVMISSFRATVAHWLDHTLRADMYVSYAGPTPADGIPAVVVEGLRALSSVRRVDTRRWLRLETVSEPTRLLAIDFDAESLGYYQLVEGDAATMWPGFRDRDQVIVSESYAYHNDIGVGAVLVLPTASGDAEFEVAGVFVDFRSERGLVVMHRQVYLRHWQDPAVTSLAVYLQPGAAAAPVLAQMEAGLLRDSGLRARANGRLRQLSLEIFDRTFAVTQVLRLLTLVVAAIGIVSALSAIQLERAREFAVLRASGLTRGELFGLQMGEGGLMGLLGGVLAIPLGSVMAALLVHVINRRSFGWSMQMDWTATPFLLALALSLVAGLLAGLYPAWRLARTDPAVALRHAD